MLYTAFILGLLGSFHCIGMCGPIAFALPVDRTSKSKMVFQTMLYHFGRLFTYSLIGLVFGLVGRGLYLAGFQQRLSILIGVLMIAMVLIPVHVFNKHNFSKPIYKGISYVKSKLGYYLKKRTNSTFFTIGFFNGFLPCGLVYMALVGSIAASGAFEGAIYMSLFGLGTVPMMSAAVLTGNFLKGTLRTKIQKAIPVFVVIIGLLFILRGLGLGIPYVSPSDVKLQVTNTTEVCE
ncbi:sulfite exporter TauE/SafE family protein [Aureibaculum conchae]|uniref:sulfite exporter TauE/SafE family protein n=1 Tax=Aureibaculum sp. 2308TA14-22 TaxID=3108392 RepID=UPI003395D851